MLLAESDQTIAVDQPYQGPSYMKAEYNPEKLSLA